MQLENYYWCFHGAIPSRICDDIVAYGKELKEQAGVTFGYDPDNMTPNEQKKLEKQRSSNVVWMDPVWIYRELHPLVNEANANAGWNFQWDYSEPCQFTIYNEGQYYGWHTDSSGVYYEARNKNGLIRKLSVTVSLSHPHEYEGGTLEFDTRSQDEPDSKSEIIKCKQILPKGSICVFPSFTYHRVSPVTKGRRLSLVQWNLGPEWR